MNAVIATSSSRGRAARPLEADRRARDGNRRRRRRPAGCTACHRRVFYPLGRTKVDGWLTFTDSAHSLFREEYKVPLIPPEVAAHPAGYAEHFFPLLLVLGLATRLSPPRCWG